MTAADLIRQCRSRGVVLSTKDGRLTYRGPRDAIEGLLPAIRRHKAEIIAELQAANEDGDCLAMRRCPVCGTDTLHQRLEGQWRCTRRHPPWPRFDDSDRTGPVVECWTPAGGRILIRARDQEHAEWLRRMNPPPESVTKSNSGGER